MLLRLIVCAALALVAVPAAAHADGEPPAIPVPAAEPLMTGAHSLAVARWGTDPCGGQVSTTWAHLGTGINARSQWMSIDVHDPSTYSECAITYNLDVDWDWPKLCTVIEHELGHLAGHDHVDDPHDLMSPYYVYPSAECAPVASQASAAAPDRAPRWATSSKRASSAKGKAKTRASAKRKARSRRAAAAAKRRASKRTKAHSASMSRTPGFYGCVLVDAR